MAGELDRTIFGLVGPGQPKDSPLRFGKISRIEDQFTTQGQLFTIGEGPDARRMVMLDLGGTPAVGDYVYWLDQLVPLALGPIIMGTIPVVGPPAAYAGPTLTSITKSATNTPGTAHTITLPGTTVAGELLLAALMWNANTTITGPGGGWTKLSGNAMSPGQSEIWAKIATGSDGASAAFTSSTSQAGAFMVARIQGNFNSLVSGTGYNLAVSSASSTTTPNPPTVTAGWGVGDILFVAVSTVRGDNTAFSGYPAGYTNGDYQVTTNGGGGGASVGMAV
ncbi:MAG: hypothetical protein OEY41_17520, partial [Acidimicrobiia bacterium]|nr:hypothetical protein [Acidimicrobiia bacterium]